MYSPSHNPTKANRYARIRVCLTPPVFFVAKKAPHFFSARSKRGADASLQPSQSFVYLHRSLDHKKRDTLSMSMERTSMHAHGACDMLTVETVYYRMRELYTAKYHVIHSLITCHHGNTNIYHMTARAINICIANLCEM